jgi:hypothetical protein
MLPFLAKPSCHENALNPRFLFLKKSTFYFLHISIKNGGLGQIKFMDQREIVTLVILGIKG